LVGWLVSLKKHPHIGDVFFRPKF